MSLNSRTLAEAAANRGRSRGNPTWRKPGDQYRNPNFSGFRNQGNPRSSPYSGKDLKPVPGTPYFKNDPNARMRFNPNARLDPSQVQDRRGQTRGRQGGRR